MAKWTDTETAVTRWHHDRLGHMVTEPDGEYVAYADHVRDMAQLRAEVDTTRDNLAHAEFDRDHFQGKGKR